MEGKARGQRWWEARLECGAPCLPEGGIWNVFSLDWCVLINVSYHIPVCIYLISGEFLSPSIKDKQDKMVQNGRTRGLGDIFTHLLSTVHILHAGRGGGGTWLIGSVETWPLRGRFRDMGKMGLSQRKSSQERILHLLLWKDSHLSWV